MSKRLTLKECQELAASRGGKCLSTEYVNNRTEMRWECESGHRWKTTLFSIKNLGSWCPYCSRLKLTLDECRKIAQDRGGLCLSNEYTTSKVKIRWQCEIGHTWEALFHNIKNGGWCPECRKITIEDCQKEAEKHNGKCLSTEYVNNKTKMKWRCSEGHQWDTAFECIRRGYWCRVCSRDGLKLTLEDCQKLAKVNGGLCLSTEYVNNKTKMKWKCSEGHVWETTAGQVKNKNQWCPECAIDKMRLTLEDCHEVARERGGLCLATEYINVGTKIKWQCELGHKWESTLHHVKLSESWCPYCANAVRLTLRECQKLAEKFGGECLSDEYINSTTKMKWRCEEGHTWFASFGQIKSQKTWCAKCSGVAKLTLGDCREVAKSRGGKCLSVKYINSGTKMKWQCKDNHTWCATLNSIKSGSWCPKCSHSKTQKELLNILEKFGFEVYYNYKGFSWLKGKRRFEIDLWIPEIKLAIEYDGKQHFEPVNFGGISDKRAKDELKKTQKRDAKKDELIRKHPREIRYFIRFNYKETVTEKYVKEKLIKCGVINE